MLPFEFRIGWRYTRQGRRGRGKNGFISFISVMSVASIALGVLALIVVLSVMNGFQKEVRDRMLSVIPHIEVVSYAGPLENWQETAKIVSSDPHVLGVAPYSSGQGLLSTGSSVRGVLLRGIEPADEGKVSEIDRQMAFGKLTDLKPGEYGIVLGRDLARLLRLRVGDKVNVIIPQGRATPAGIVPRMRAFTLTGVFSSGHYEYDSSMALIHIEDAQALFRQSGPAGLRVRVDDMNKAPEISFEILKTLPDTQVEKRMMAIILFLIVLVGAFGLVSSMVMTVTEKQSDIAILRTLGASPASIMSIFMVQGAVVGVVGVACGVALGLLIACNLDVIVPAIESLFGIQFLPKEVYFISSLPSDPRVGDIVPIAVFSLILSLLATIYPAEALRYE